MKYLVSNDGSSFRIDKLFDEDIELLKVHIEEGLYGDIPDIVVNLKTDKELCKINQEFTGSLISKDGYTNKFKCFVYDITYNLNEMEIKFMCCLPKFTKDRVVTKYTTIDNAIQSTYQLDRLDDVKTDLLDFSDPWYIYQKNETNYHLCRRLCKSYKHNTVFGFLLSGLRFRDLLTWKPEVILRDKVDINLQSPSNWIHPKLYDQELKFVDYNSNVVEFEKDPNHQFVEYYEDIIPVNNIYKELIGNFLFNQRLELSKNINEFQLKFLPVYQVGDFVKIPSEQIIFNNCFISHRIIDMTKADISVHYTIQSIDP